MLVHSFVIVYGILTCVCINRCGRLIRHNLSNMAILSVQAGSPLHVFIKGHWK